MRALLGLFIQGVLVLSLCNLLPNLVHLLVLVSLLIALPRLQVGLHTGECAILRCKMRHEGSHGSEQGHGYVVDEAWLSARHVRRLAVAQHGHWQLHLLLEITLLKELIEQEIRPFVHHFEAAASLRDITGVQATLENELLVLEVLC